MLLLRMMQLLLTLLLLYVCSMCVSSIAQGVRSVTVALMRKADTLRNLSFDFAAISAATEALVQLLLGTVLEALLLLASCTAAACMAIIRPVPWLLSQCLGIMLSAAQWLLSMCMWVLSAVQAVVHGICNGAAQGTCRVLVQAVGKEDLHLALPGGQLQAYLAAAPCMQLLMLAPALGWFVTVGVPAVLVGCGGTRAFMWLVPDMTAKETCVTALLLGILAASVCLVFVNF